MYQLLIPSINIVFSLEVTVDDKQYVTLQELISLLHSDMASGDVICSIERFVDPRHPG